MNAFELEQWSLDVREFLLTFMNFRIDQNAMLGLNSGDVDIAIKMADRIAEARQERMKKR